MLEQPNYYIDGVESEDDHEHKYNSRIEGGSTLLDPLSTLAYSASAFPYSQKKSCAKVEKYFEVERISTSTWKSGELAYRVHWVGYKTPTWVSHKMLYNDIRDTVIRYNNADIQKKDVEKCAKRKALRDKLKKSK
jgi:hypothetical protein